MDRRKFIGVLSVTPVVLAVAGCGRQIDSSLRASASDGIAAGFKSFGYYQGLSPDQERSSDRTDGTYYNMPCISEDDVAAGLEKTYTFWHGHGPDHTFTLTAADFQELAMGRSVEVYTSVVGGHRHALRVSPSESCRA